MPVKTPPVATQKPRPPRRAARARGVSVRPKKAADQARAQTGLTPNALLAQATEAMEIALSGLRTLAQSDAAAHALVVK